jgi:ribonuclease HI
MALRSYISAVTPEAPPTVAYTDGACSGNPGPGGWAWIVPEARWASGPDPDTTNQRMELKAVLEAVGALPRPLHIISDSTYVVNCFRDRWWEGWIKRGWKNSQKKPVANRDLWEPLIELVREGGVTFEWVKGHAGDEWNDYADRLAVEAGWKQKGRTGDTPPANIELPEPGSSRAASTSSTASDRDPTGREPPAGHRLAVLGMRNIDVTPTLRRKVAEIIDAKAQMNNDLVVMTGLRMGAEEVGAVAAEQMGVPFVAVLPYPEPQSVWPKAAQERFDGQIKQAREVITLQGKSPDSKQKATGALRRRDSWFVRNSHEALVIWDGEDDLVGKLVRSLQEPLGDEVWIIDPAE